MFLSSTPQPSHIISAGSGEGRNQGHTYSRYRENRRNGTFLTPTSTSHVACVPLPAGKSRYSQRNTNSLKSLHQQVCSSLTGSRSTVLHTEHGSSVMVLLIQGTEGLFYSLPKDNDNLCNTAAICVSVEIAFFFSFRCFFEWKKGKYVGKRNWPIKSHHMFLILKMFPFNRPWGTKRITFIHIKHMTNGAKTLLGSSQ